MTRASSCVCVCDKSPSRSCQSAFDNTTCLSDKVKGVLSTKSICQISKPNKRISLCKIL